MCSPVKDVVSVTRIVRNRTDHGAREFHGAGLAGADLILLDKISISALNVELGTKSIFLWWSKISVVFPYPFLKTFPDEKNFCCVFLVIQLTIP